MVEFGLKLEDNKVSEWGEFYLTYEALKAMLKKAKTASKKYEEQAQKRPEDAAQILRAHRAGNQEYVTSITPSSSRVNLLESTTTKAGVVPSSPPTATASGSSRQDTMESAFARTESTEKTGLLREPSERTSSDYFTSSSSSRPAGSTFSLTDYFGSSRYERTLRGYLQEIDDRGEAFAKSLTAEQTKCVGFYKDKLNELEKRLALLIETVASSALFKRSLSDSMDEEDSITGVRHNIMTMGGGGPHHRRKSSDMSWGGPRQRFGGLLKTWQAKINENSSQGTTKGGSSIGAHQHVSKSKVTEATRTKLTNEDSDEEDGVYDKDDERAIAEADSIRRALIDQYRAAKLLQNYAILNYTGFVKIIKKHDKTLPTRSGRFKDMLERQNLFDEGKAVEHLAEQYEQFYANWFCEGDIRAAHAQMLPKRGDGLEMDWSQLRLGYRMGMCAVLALWVCWDSVWGLVADGNSTIGGRSAFPVFRACGGILLLQWFWGCSVFVWTRYRINYIYLFDFNPKIVETPLGIFADAVDNTLVFNILMLLYYKSGANDIPQILPDGVYPFILVVYTVWQLIFPLKSRLPMWEAIYKVLTAPMHSPSFFHGYIGDIFTSMVKVFQDIAWTTCWVISGAFTRSEDMKNKTEFSWSTAHWYKNILIPILCLLPLLIRFNQCLRRYIDTGDRFPHLANATKYALSQTVTLFGAFHPLYLELTPEVRDPSNNSSSNNNIFQGFWMLVFVGSSLYSFAWDVFMDWGLGRRKHGYLGPSLMYPRRYYYYSVMAIDLVLRFMWVLTLVPPSSGARFEVPSYLTAVTMMLELFRRTAWGFFRLENEHRSNAAGFRRVSFVPLHFHTGHEHGYKESKEQSGVTVLREVILIACMVGAVCVWSVISAQRANKIVEQQHYAIMNHHHPRVAVEDL